MNVTRQTPPWILFSSVPPPPPATPGRGWEQLKGHGIENVQGKLNDMARPLHGVAGEKWVSAQGKIKQSWESLIGSGSGPLCPLSRLFLVMKQTQVESHILEGP